MEKHVQPRADLRPGLWQCNQNFLLSTMPVTPQVPGLDGPLLNCLIEDEYKVFDVTVEHNWRVTNLKKAIQSERALSILKDVDPNTLELWKVSPINDLAM